MSIGQLDYQLFQMINHLSVTGSFLNPLMRLFAQQAEYVFYLGVMVYWFTRRSADRNMVVEALVSACIAMLVSGLLGHFFYRDRPFVAHSVIQLIPHAANASFPSDHAIGAFVIASSIWISRKKAGGVLLVLAACIAFARIWTGVHYPSDVLAGALIGMMTAASIHQFIVRAPWVRSGISAGIVLYEKVETKVWPIQHKHVNEQTID